MVDLNKLNFIDGAEKNSPSVAATNLQPRLHQVPFSKNESRFVRGDETGEFNYSILKQAIKELPNVFRISRIHKPNPFQKLNLFHFPPPTAK